MRGPGSRLWASLLCVGMLALSCGEDGPETPADLQPECTERTHCGAGQVCTSDGRCAGCESSGQCLLKEVCQPESLLCALKEGWGAECTLNEACAAGQWCRQGLCVARELVTLCPSGEREECPPGQRCQPVNLVCEEDLGCAENGDCGAEEVCNRGSRTCVPRCTSENASSVCAEGERCDASGKCAQCVADTDCGAGLRCDSAGRCAAGPRCYGDRDCRVPQVCHVPTGACVTAPPPCISDENCASDQRCEVSSGRCVARNCVGDRFEPNDLIDDAEPLVASRYDKLTLCAGDVDWFAVSLNRGDELGINLQADPFAEFTFTTSIHDASGRALATGRLLASYVATGTATYYVSVRTSDSYQPYDVRVLLSKGTPCDDDAFEPNDSAGSATPLNASTELDGAICPQDKDHLSLAVPSGKGVTVSLAGYEAARGQLQLCLMEGDTSLGCSESAAPSVSLDAAVAGGKSLIARISGVSALSANTYTFQVVYP